MTGSAQKFIARNRAPRVQIEYDVELYGAEKKVQLPFVMGVMSDLAGKSNVAQPSIENRKFLEIDVDNFDERMQAMQPRAAFSVPNTLTGEGNLEVDLTFEAMDDFSPQAIAAKIEPLRKLLQARTELANLATYMDGKVGAETLIERILQDPTLLQSLSSMALSDDQTDAALDALRAAAPEEDIEQDQATAALNALRATAPQDVAAKDEVEGALDALRTVAPTEKPDNDETASALDALRAAAPEQDDAEDQAGATLEALRNAAPTDPEPQDNTTSALDGLRSSAAEEPESTADAALEGLRSVAADAPEGADSADEALEGLRATAPPEPEADNSADAALDHLRDTPLPETQPETAVQATLEGLKETAPPDADKDDTSQDVLAALAEAPIADGEPVAVADDVLFSLRDESDDKAPQPDTRQDALANLMVDPPEVDAPDTTMTDALAGLTAPDEHVAEEPDVNAALASLAEVAPPEEGNTGAVLADLVDTAPEPVAQTDTTGAALDSLAQIDAPAETDGDSNGAPLAELADTPSDPAYTVNTTPPALDEPAGIEAGREPVPDESDGTLEDLARDDVAGGDPAATGLDDLDDLLGAGSDPDPLDEFSALSNDPVAAEAEIRDLSVADIGDSDASGYLDDLLDASALNQPSDALTNDVPDIGTDDLDGLNDLEDLLDADTGPDPLDDLTSPALDALQAERAGPSVGDADTASAGDDLDDLLGDVAAESASEPADLSEPAGTADDLDDLDSLLAEPTDLDAEHPAADESHDLEPTERPTTPVSDPEETDDLDDLLSDLGGETEDGTSQADADRMPSDVVAEEALETSTAARDGLDDLLSDLDVQDASADIPDSAPPAKAGPEAEFAFGVMTGARPDAQRLNRKRFRMAVMGDFSGRAARGLIEIGDALAARPAIQLDPDTVDEVISGFGTTLMLPIGKEGAGVEVVLGELDDLHPDELYEKVGIFSELVGLRAQLSSGATAEHAAKTLRAWGEEHGTPVAPARRTSSGNAVPADRRLSDFQKLIGDTTARLTQPSPVEDLLARIVGPHIRAVPDADAMAMQAAVDQALSAAMRLVLHHPEFQSIESQWRSIDLIARSIEVDDTLEVVLYDISAEEIAADLASVDDLTQSGFARLLTESPLDEETGRGGYSALIGLYTVEETPPHAELLGRIARVAAHVDAPFLAALSPAFMDIAKEDRHPLVATAWDTLRAMPEAGHLGLLSPRFLLRRPYGAKSEPIYEFEFEEFTMADGLSGMLWANPVVLAAILLAKSYRENGVGMGLGGIMSLGDMPYHFVTDRYGDQVALPCTERNLTLEKVEKVMARGVMPVVSIKGRDEIRLASFQSLAGGDILGPWSDVPPPPPSPPKPAPVMAPEPVEQAEDAEDDLGLDDLLAGFGDDQPAVEGEAGSDDIDADLAALLEDL